MSGRATSSVTRPPPSPAALGSLVEALDEVDARVAQQRAEQPGHESMVELAEVGVAPQHDVALGARAATSTAPRPCRGPRRTRAARRRGIDHRGAGSRRPSAVRVARSGRRSPAISSMIPGRGVRGEDRHDVTRPWPPRCGPGGTPRPLSTLRVQQPLRRELAVVVSADRTPAHVVRVDGNHEVAPWRIRRARVLCRCGPVRATGPT